MTYKKSQTELLGLAIIVVLILIATVFVARFFISKDGSSSRKSYVVSEQATSMVKSILNTESGCLNFKFSEMFKRCAESQKVAGCDSVFACEFLNKKLEEGVFKETFDVWGKDYKLEAYALGKTVLQIKKSDCSNSQKDKEVTEFPIKTDSSEVHIRLEVCG